MNVLYLTYKNCVCIHTVLKHVFTLCKTMNTLKGNLKVIFSAVCTGVLKPKTACLICVHNTHIPRLRGKLPARNKQSIFVWVQSGTQHPLQHTDLIKVNIALKKVLGAKEKQRIHAQLRCSVESTIARAQA